MGERSCFSDRFPATTCADGPGTGVTATVRSAGSLRHVTLPTFRADDDPGPSFLGVLARTGGAPAWAGLPASPAGPSPFEPTHGTTVVAIRFADGVVMAGDRRATAGNLIAHRNMEKVFPADRHSGVAIAGAAGPAVEMVKLFQLQLEHYEKVEGAELSLEGKANQLGQMVRSHLPAAMQGFVVVPLFAGFDVRRGVGRLFEYDVTGGRYEESDFAATGSGSLHAGTVIKLGFSPGLDRDSTVELAINSLFQAADEDSATGGPDLVRGIFPVVATITANGFERLSDDEVATRFRALLDRLSAPGSTTVTGTTPTIPGGSAR
jgi:proteasome beta subunit